MPGITVRFLCQHSPQYRSAGASLEPVWPRVRLCSHAASRCPLPTLHRQRLCRRRHMFCHRLSYIKGKGEMCPAVSFWQSAPPHQGIARAVIYFLVLCYILTLEAFKCGNAGSQYVYFFGCVTPTSLVKPSIFLALIFTRHETGMFPVDSPECLSVTTANKQRFLVASSPHPHYNPVIKQLGVRVCATDMELMFPVEWTLLDSLPSCFLSFGWQCGGACGEKTEKLSGDLRKRGRLLLLNSALKIYCTNIGLWLHQFRHCETKYSCWWVSLTSDHCPTPCSVWKFLSF